MPSRRQIREAVVQFLYAEGPEGIPSPSGEIPSLHLLLEPFAQKVTLARAKALVHLQQGREKVSAGVHELAEELALLKPVDGGGLQPIADFIAAEQDLARHLDFLQRELHGNKNPAVLADLLDDCRRASATGSSAAARLEEITPDLAGPARLCAQAGALAEALRPYRERLLVALADKPGPQPELKAVRRALEAATKTRERIAGQLEGLATCLPEIDGIIAAAVENYSPERLDRVDRAILRLATFEMLHDNEVPPAVAINEAIDLAREFGTTGSPSFVNGVLDRIRKSAPSQSQPNL